MSQKVTDNAYQLRLAHSKILYWPDEQLLVDTGPESEWDALHQFLEDNGGVTQLFVSHNHGDHIGNLERIIDTYDPEILYPENEPLVDSVSESEVTRISDGETIGSGLEVVEVPGHTEGICGLYAADQSTFFATDVLDGADRRGLPEGYLLPPPAAYNVDSDAAELNLERLLELEFETAVVTHGTNVDSDACLKLEKFLDFPNHYRAELLSS